MPGDFVALTAHDLFNYMYLPWPSMDYTVVPKENPKLSTKNTYFLIFNKKQKQHWEAFFSWFKGKVVFISKPSCNSIHPGATRNVLVVFECLSDSAEKGYGP